MFFLQYCKKQNVFKERLLLLDNLFLGFWVVIPIFTIVILGHLTARRGLVKPGSFIDMNNLVFTLFIPAHLFYSIAGGNVENVLDFKFLGIVLALILVMTAILLLIIPRLEKDPKKIGVMIQGIYRTNYVILGFPILTSLYGPSILDLGASILLISMPVFNILSITILGYYTGKKTDLRTMLAAVIKSPLVIATLLGMLAMPFTLPSVIQDTMRLLSQVSTPLALFVLGGLLDMKGVGANWRDLNIVMVARLIIVPLVFLHLAHLLGFHEQQLMTLMVFSAAPTAVVSYSMTLYLGGDDRLAQQIILYTTALSVFTYVFWIYYVLTFLA
jgi:predicted permease